MKLACVAPSYRIKLFSNTEEISYQGSHTKEDCRINRQQRSHSKTEENPKSAALKEAV